MNNEQLVISNLQLKVKYYIMSNLFIMQWSSLRRRIRKQSGNVQLVIANEVKQSRLEEHRAKQLPNSLRDLRHCERSEAIQKEGGGRYPSRNHYQQYEPVRISGLLHFVRNDELHVPRLFHFAHNDVFYNSLIYSAV
jgi:hypothetical protein